MIKTEAIILKTADSNEVDRLLTIYTKEFGKIQAAARGVKKLESKLRYSIEPISYVSMILVEGKNFLILKDAVIIDQFLDIKQDLEKIKIAQKLVNLIDEAIVGEEKDENIWNLILATFRDINVGAAISCIERGFKDELLRLLGYDPKQIKDLKDMY